MKLNIRLENVEELQHQLTIARVALGEFIRAIEQINNIEIEMKTSVEEEAKK